MEEDEEGTDFIYRFILEGTADNSEDKAIYLMTQFKDLLVSESRVLSVSIENLRNRGTNYLFRMVVLPSFQGYQT